MNKGIKKILSLIVAFSLIFSAECFYNVKFAYADENEKTVTESKNEEESNKDEESKSESESESESESTTESESESESTTESESESESTTESESESESTTKSESESESTTESESESESTTESESESESTAESEIESESTTESKSESEVESGSEANSKSKKASSSEIVEEEAIEKIATSSDASEIKYEDLDTYSQFVFNDSDSVEKIDGNIVLKKDIQLEKAITFAEDLTLDLAGFNIDGPKDNYALYVTNNFTLINSTDNAGTIISSNSEYPVIYFENASATLKGGKIHGAIEGGDAIHLYNSDLTIDGTVMYGGNGKSSKDEIGGKGGDAIVVNESKLTNKINVYSGYIRGGNGGNGIGDDLAQTGSAIVAQNISFGGRYFGKSDIANTTGGGRGGNGITINTDKFKSDNLYYEYYTICPGSAGNTSRVLFRTPRLLGANPPAEAVYSLKNLNGKNYLTSFKNQGGTDLCTAFSTIAYAETNMLLKYQEYAHDVLGFDVEKTLNRETNDNEVNFSEIYFAMSYYRQPKDEFGNAGESKTLKDSLIKSGNPTVWSRIGADSGMISSLLASWRGIVVEDDYYRWDSSSARLSEQLNSPAVKNKLDEYTNKTIMHAKSTRTYDLRNFSNNSTELVNTLKNTIKNRGGALIGMRFSGSQSYPSTLVIDGVNYGSAVVYYANQVITSNMGHELYAFGWDDNLTVTAGGVTSTGAFLCKDSYDRIGLVPYSYRWSAKSSSAATSDDMFSDFTDIDWELGFSTYENNYYYDATVAYDGLEFISAFIDNSSGSSSGIHYDFQSYYSSIINIFKVRNLKEKVKGINVFHSRDDEVNVEVYKVTGNTVDALKNKTSANLLASKTATLHRGATNIIFDNAFDVEKDDYLAIIVHKSNGEKFTDFPIDITTSAAIQNFNFVTEEKNSSYYGDFAPDTTFTVYNGTEDITSTLTPEQKQQLMNQKKYVKVTNINLRVKLLTNNYVELHSNTDSTFDGGNTNVLYYPTLRASMSDIPVPVITPTKKFDKYTTNEDGTGDIYTSNSLYNIKIASFLKLYAQYKDRYQVTFNTTIGTAPAPVYADSNNKVPKPMDPTADGYIFEYWYKDNINEEFDFDNTVLTSSITLNAKWKQLYRATFITAYGTAPNQSYTDRYGKVTKPANPAATGHVFKYWYATSSNIPFDFDNSVINEDTSFTAFWKNSFRVTFNSNGGSGNYGPLDIEEGNYKLPGEVFTKSGYQMSSWKDENNNVYNLLATINLTTNKSLTALWEKIPSGGGGGPSGGGGGGGGGGIPVQQNQATKETVVNINTTAVTPIDTTTNSAWTVDALGKWHVSIAGLDGSMTEVKNMWCSIASNKVVNNVPIVVVDYYFMGSDGTMTTGWLVDAENRKYYLDTAAGSEIGKMTRGWKKIDDGYYYFDSNGVLFVNGVTPDGFNVDTKGKWIQ